MEKYYVGFERAMLLKTISEKKLSPLVLEKTSMIIKHIREHKGHQMADNKAQELRLIIETCKTEQEVLENL